MKTVSQKVRHWLCQICPILADSQNSITRTLFDLTPYKRVIGV